MSEAAAREAPAAMKKPNSAARKPRLLSGKLNRTTLFHLSAGVGVRRIPRSLTGLRGHVAGAPNSNSARTRCFGSTQSRRTGVRRSGGMGRLKPRGYQSLLTSAPAALKGESDHAAFRQGRTASQCLAFGLRASDFSPIAQPARIQPARLCGNIHPMPAALAGNPLPAVAPSLLPLLEPPWTPTMTPSTRRG